MIKSFKQFINESVDYGNIINRELPSVIQDCNNYLKQFNLSIYLDEEFDEFGDIEDDWVAIYRAGSVVDYDGEMTIGFNNKSFIDFCTEEECTEKEAEEQISVSIWHELGHGMVDWMRNEVSNYYDMMDQDPDDIPEHVDKIMDEFYNKWEHILTETDDEEDIVEEFGISMGGGFRARNHDLEDMIEDFKKYIEVEW